MTSNERRKRAAELHNKKRDENIAAREARRIQLEQIREKCSADGRSGPPVVIAGRDEGATDPSECERPERKKVAVCGGVGHVSSTVLLLGMSAMLAADASVTRNVIDNETRNAYRKPRTIRSKK